VVLPRINCACGGWFTSLPFTEQTLFIHIEIYTHVVATLTENRSRVLRGRPTHALEKHRTQS